MPLLSTIPSLLLQPTLMSVAILRSTLFCILIILWLKGADCPVGESDGQAILGDLQALLPNIQQSLTDIVARKAAFQALPLGGITALVQQDLASLSRNTDNLASAFIACAPVRPSPIPFYRKADVEQADIVEAGQQLQSEIDAAFSPAIDAFN